MKRTDILEFISEQLNITLDELDDEATLDELGMDEITLSELIYAINDKYEMEMEDEDFADCETLGEFIDTVIESAEE